jgi:hypothetical protein
MDKKDSLSSTGGINKKSGSATSKLPPVVNATQQLETVSPATRLLEKRRLMYEKQEEYEQKKKHFKL